VVGGSNPPSPTNKQIGQRELSSPDKPKAGQIGNSEPGSPKPRGRTSYGLRGPGNVGLVKDFVDSRRKGLSPRTYEFYTEYLERYARQSRIPIEEATWQNLAGFLEAVPTSGLRDVYWRVLSVFYNWLARKGHIPISPMKEVPRPKQPERIQPALTAEEIERLITAASSARDKAIVSLFADSGLRLRELTAIRHTDIKWETSLVRVIGKGNKEAYAPFGERTAGLLKDWLGPGIPRGNIWGLQASGIRGVLRRLEKETRLECNPHVFRRSFASILNKRGVDMGHIMRLGRWQSLDMVVLYTKSVRFEDSLKHYQPIAGKGIQQELARVPLLGNITLS